MEGIGPGSVLGDRYAATTRLDGPPGGFERWRAHDRTLEREVVLLCFDSADPQASAALDAARRAAGVEDRRLVRVLDVGTSGPISWVVEEPLPDFVPLAELLSGGGIVAEEARRIAGETATGLAAAGTRGLHHQVLTPANVLRSPDGTIKVRGLATEAALRGIETDDPTLALRTDATAIAALAYAALTGRWPGPGLPGSGAPGTGGPGSPGEPAASGAAPDPVHGLFAAPTMGDGVAPASELAAGVPEDLDRLLTTTLRGEGRGPAGPAEMAAAMAPWSSIPVDLQMGGADPERGPGGPVTAGPNERTEVFRAPDEPAAEPSAGSGPSVDPTIDPRTGSSPDPRTNPRTESGRLPGWRRGAEASTVGLDELYGPIADDHVEPRVALPERVVDAVAERPNSRQSRLALLIVGVFVLVAAIIGYLALPRLGGVSTTEPTTTSTGLATLGPKTTPTTAGTSTSSAPSTTTAPVALTPIPVVGAAGFDPQGDGIEGNNVAKNVIDGDPNTLWRSQWYNSEKFGGLPKQGVGVVLDLGKPTPIHRVAVTLPAGQDLTVYAAPGASLDGATPIGTQQVNEQGSVTVAAPDGAPVTAQYVILWVTKLIPDEGKWRASIAEAQIL